jgi:hypothetical protein
MKTGMLAGILTMAFWGQAGANIVNGDFEAPTDLAHWVAVGIGDPGDVLAEEITGPSDELHMMAANSYTWDGDDWLLSEEEIGSIAIANNPSDYQLFAPAGTDALSFDARVAVASIAGDELERLLVEVAYNFDGAVFGASQSLWLGEEDWTRHSLSLPGLDTSKQMNISVYARGGDGLTGQDGVEPGATTNVIAEGWFDNFAFVPEPASMLVLAVGGCAMLLRRKR